MTFDQIKSEITARLREVRSESGDLSGAEMYPDLQKLITRAISRVALCDTAADLDRLNDLLEAIEDTYNSCRTDVSGEESNETLFDFNFELESEGDNDGPSDEEGSEEPEPDDDGADAEEEEESEDAGETEEAPPARSEKQEREIAACVAEIEEFYKAHYSKGGIAEKNRLKAIRTRALDRVESTNTPVELTDAVIEYRKNFDRYKKSLEAYDRREDAKPSFDSKHNLNTKLNFARLFAGILAAVAGVVAGAVSREWLGFPLAAMIFGGTYLLLGGVYAIIITKSLDAAAYRNTAFARLIIAVIAVIGSVILGITLPASEGFGFGYAFLSTLPLTLGGIGVYIICRLQLSIFVAKNRKAKKKKR